MEEQHIHLKPFYTKRQFKLNDKQKFRIKMENFHLNSMGRVYKVQELNSEYEREIEKKYGDLIVFTNYKWGDINFQTKLPNKPSEKIEWTFAKGKGFKSLIILSSEKLYDFSEGENVVTEKTHLDCFNSITEGYKSFPVLPASYLVVMQTLDIVGFEMYLSYIYSRIGDGKVWELDELVTITPPESEYVDVCNIDFDMFSKQSYFRNSKFKIKLTGYGRAKEVDCAIFDYHCDHSKVSMQDRYNSDVKRNGTSYYHGQLWINLKTSELERGTMFESYLAIQEGEKQSDINVRRRVLCERVNN